MTYSVPRPVTVAATAVKLCDYDGQRTSLLLTNIATETKYLSSRNDVATSGLTVGTPIYQSDRFAYDRGSGSDPRLERWAIGTVTGGNIIVEEEFSGSEPETPLLRIMKDILGTLKFIGAGLIKTR